MFTADSAVPRIPNDVLKRPIPRAIHRAAETLIRTHIDEREFPPLLMILIFRLNNAVSRFAGAFRSMTNDEQNGQRPE
jgi:hypothetical protein